MAQTEDDPGVLILSEFAGAAEQLTDALIVNPHDTGRLANTILNALNMSLDERQERWRKLKAIVEDQDIAWWSDKYLKDLMLVDAKAA